jgi:hypothetical protein
MSTINAANITDGTDTVATGYVVNGSIKAWSNINQTNTQVIRDSLNTSSLTDDAVGNTRITYTSAFNNTNYCHFGTSSGTSGSDGDHGFVPHASGSGNTTSQSHQVRCARHDSNRTDVQFLMHGTIGDLA